MKHNGGVVDITANKSPPMRGRGLKHLAEVAKVR